MSAPELSTEKDRMFVDSRCGSREGYNAHKHRREVPCQSA